MSRRIGFVPIIIAATVLMFGVVAPFRHDQMVVRFAVAASNADSVTRDWLPPTSRSIYSQRLPYDWHLDERFGFSYVLVPRVTGVGTVSALIGGNADIALMSAVPLNQALSEGHDLTVLAQTERSYRQVRLVTTAEHTTDWPEHPIGIVPNTTLQVMLISVLRDEGLLSKLDDGSLVQVESRSPIGSIDQILAGAVESVVVFQANAYSLTSANEQFVDITTDDGYLSTFYLVTTEQRLAVNREAILRAMEATAESRRIVAADPDRRLKEIQEQEAGPMGAPEGPPYFWNVDEIVFDTDADQIRNDLTADAELMVLGGLIPSVPNYDRALNELAAVAERT